MLSFNTAALLNELNKVKNKVVYNKVTSVVKKLHKIKYESKEGELDELVLIMLAIGQKEQAFISFLGQVASMLNITDPGIIAADMIMILVEEDLLDIDFIGSRILIQSRYLFDLEEQEKHIVFVEDDVNDELEMHDYNFGHMILGGYLKQSRYTDMDNIRLDYLDYMNGIPLSLNIELLQRRVIQPSEAQKGTPEWNEFKKNLYAFYKEIVSKGNVFNIIHKFDNRGRCYANSYYANYQGNDFQKAVIQLAHKEIVNETI